MVFGCFCRLLVLSGTCYRILAGGILLHVSSAGCFLCWLDKTRSCDRRSFFAGCTCPCTDQLYLTFLFFVTWLKALGTLRKKADLQIHTFKALWAKWDNDERRKFYERWCYTVATSPLLITEHLKLPFRVEFSGLEGSHVLKSHLWQIFLLSPRLPGRLGSLRGRGSSVSGVHAYRNESGSAAFRWWEPVAYLGSCCCRVCICKSSSVVPHGYIFLTWKMLIAEGSSAEMASGRPGYTSQQADAGKKEKDRNSSGPGPSVGLWCTSKVQYRFLWNLAATDPAELAVAGVHHKSVVWIMDSGHSNSRVEKWSTRAKQLSVLW